jgi:hypothetical protein
MLKYLLNKHQVGYKEHVHFIQFQVLIHLLKWQNIFLMLKHQVYHHSGFINYIFIFYTVLINQYIFIFSLN